MFNKRRIKKENIRLFLQYFFNINLLFSNIFLVSNCVTWASFRSRLQYLKYVDHGDCVPRMITERICNRNALYEMYFNKNFVCLLKIKTNCSQKNNQQNKIVEMKNESKDS